MRFFQNSDATLDSRVIDKRIAELGAIRTALTSQVDLTEFDEGDEGEELIALRDLHAQDDQRHHDAWMRGLTLINDDYFETYARETAEDLHGDMDNWPFSHINWTEAADTLRQDYVSVTFDGQVFWVRA